MLPPDLPRWPLSAVSERYTSYDVAQSCQPGRPAKCTTFFSPPAMFFSAPFPAGLENFSSLFAALPTPARDVRHLARALDVSERSVRDWIAGRRQAPRAACFFLWCYSTDAVNWVNERAASEASFHARQHAAAARRVADLEATVAALRADLAGAKKAASAANDVWFSDNPQPPHAPFSTPRPPFHYRA